MTTAATALFLLGLFYLTSYSSVSAISCYVCESVNGSNPGCEDTFMNGDDFYSMDCRSRRRQREGTFPSQYCIKFKATDLEIENYTIVVRDCAVDDGGVNYETEIGRLSHCGWFERVYYNGRYMRGCVSTCKITGCNSAETTHFSATLFSTVCSLAMAAFHSQTN